MSTDVFPSLVGLSFPVKKSPIWSSRVMTSVSGKETRIADWSHPKFAYELSYELLRSDSSHLELQTLMNFYNWHHGQFDTWLFDDPDDNSVIDQRIGTGDGVNLAVQLVRTMSGSGGSWFNIDILAPNIVSEVKIDGVATTDYTLHPWGVNNPGWILFGSPAASGAVITATFTYYIPCRFTDDSIDFDKFMDKKYEVKSIKFLSVK